MASTTAESEWYRLCRRYDVGDTVTSDWWRRLDVLYGDTGRYYHTMQHVARMLTLMPMARTELSTKPGYDQEWILAMAIYFHDSIYCARATDNEEKSAELFLEFAQNVPSLSTSMTQSVYWMIHSTKAHRVIEKPSTIDSSYWEQYHLDCAYLLDFDLEILAASPEDYTTYARHIRSEYAHVPASEYGPRRIEVLKTLCSNGVFITTSFKEKFEAVAHRNVQTEMERLGAAS